MTAKNVDVENEEVKKTGLPPQEKVLQTEKELIEGLFAASEYETDEDCMKEIQIKRNGKLFFTFTVRPLSESEVQRIRKKSTFYKRNPDGKHLPKIEDIDINKLRALKIYTATIDKDKELLWDNPQVKAGLKAKGKSILEVEDVINAVLLGGEKYNISEIIDDISGYNDNVEDEEEVSLDEYAKN